MKNFSFPPVQEIIYLQGIQNYTVVHLANGEKMLSSSTLLRHEERFEDFLRVSKSHLLNPSYITNIKVNGAQQVLELKSGKCVKISRRRQHQIKKQLALNL